MGNLGFGGMRQAANKLQNFGRYGDTMLAHITPEEARKLKKMGGSGTINPYTGLPEFWSWEESSLNPSNWGSSSSDNNDNDNDSDGGGGNLDENMSLGSIRDGDRPNDVIFTPGGDIITKVYSNDGSGNFTVISAQGNDTSQVNQLLQSGETLEDAVNTSVRSGTLDNNSGGDGSGGNTNDVNNDSPTGDDGSDLMTDDEFKDTVYNMAIDNFTDGEGGTKPFNPYDPDGDGVLEFDDVLSEDPDNLNTGFQLGVDAFNVNRIPKTDAQGNVITDADGNIQYTYSDLDDAGTLVDSEFTNYGTAMDDAGDYIMGSEDGTVKGAIEYAADVAGSSAPTVTSDTITTDDINAGMLTSDYSVDAPTQINADQVVYDDINLDNFDKKYSVEPDSYLDQGDTVSSTGVDAQTMTDIGIQNYMNPYISGVIDPAMRQIEEQRLKSLQQVGNNALANNAFGGSRQALREAETNKAAMQQAGDMSSKLYAQGYSQAANLAQQDMNRMLQADTSAAEMMMLAQKYNLDSDNLRDITNLKTQVQAGQIDAGNALNILTTNATNNLNASTSNAQFQLTADQQNSANELRAAIQSASNSLSADEINVANALLADIESGKMQLTADKQNALNNLTAQIKSGEFAQNQDAMTLDASATMGDLAQDYGNMSLDEFMTSINKGQFDIGLGDKESDRLEDGANWYTSFGFDERDRKDAFKKFGLSEFYREEDDPYKKTSAMGSIMTGAPIRNETSYSYPSQPKSMFGK